MDKEKQISLTKDEILQIAVDVKLGKRPVSDLEKYGIELGEEIEGDIAKEMLIREIEELDEFDDEDED